MPEDRLNKIQVTEEESVFTSSSHGGIFIDRIRSYFIHCFHILG